jgi:hypothetical protein
VIDIDARRARPFGHDDPDRERRNQKTQEIATWGDESSRAPARLARAAAIGGERRTDGYRVSCMAGPPKTAGRQNDTAVITSVIASTRGSS